MENNANMPTFPQSGDWQKDMEKHKANPKLYGCPSIEGVGLTKREYFAALAMQGLLASSCNVEIINEKILAEKAVMCADETLELLKK